MGPPNVFCALKKIKSLNPAHGSVLNPIELNLPGPLALMGLLIVEPEFSVGEAPTRHVHGN